MVIKTDSAKVSMARIVTELDLPRQEVVNIMINGYPGKFNSIVNDGDSVTLAKVIGGG
jgi:sulfur carrier protein ThiS